MVPDSPLKAELAARLKEARESAGLTQAQVARLMGLQRPSISEIEAGRRSVSAEELPGFAKVYGVTTAWLLGERAADRSRDVLIAAREIARLRPQDVERLLKLIESLGSEE